MFQYINIINIFKNIITLHIFSKIISSYPDLKKYSKDIRFNIYRSLMCLILTILSFFSIIKYYKMGFYFPFDYHTDEFREISELFIAYIIYDLYYMIKTKYKRKDLYFHHIFISISWFVYNYSGCSGWLSTVIIFCEILSIVSGVDKIAMEDNNMKESMVYKKIRKNIIKYIRLPIWIILFLFSMKYINRIPKYVNYNSFLGVFVMLFLDRYWEKKCDKVIDKYKSI